MHVRVLGSAAGGGFPQWNCNCPMCSGVRAGTIAAKPRTQSSIAVSSNRTDWVLFNASPDILQQIREFPALQPARELRDTGIAAVLLIDAQIDHTTGLFMLREHRRRLPIWCTAEVRSDLTDANPVFGLLEHYCGVEWHELPLHEGFDKNGFEKDGFEIPGLAPLRFKAISLTSNAPPYSPYRDRPRPGDNVGIIVEDRSREDRQAGGVSQQDRQAGGLFYAPGLAQITAPVWEAMRRAAVVLVDGTFWTDDEMIRRVASSKTAQAMGHLSQSGPEGMIATLQRLPATTRRILIHINNTNPILDETSAERRELERHGIEVAYDGMELEV